MEIGEDDLEYVTEFREEEIGGVGDDMCKEERQGGEEGREMVGEVLVDFFRWDWFGCACCRGCRCGEGGCGYHDHIRLSQNL